MPQHYKFRIFASILLIPLLFTHPSCADSTRFMTIRDGIDRPLVPDSSAIDGKYLPNSAVRYFALPARPFVTRARLPIHAVPSEPTNEGRKAHRAAPPAALVNAALTAAPGDLGPLDHIWPVDQHAKSRVTSKYGWRPDPFAGKRSFHGAVDIAAAAGTTVVATAPARVFAVGKHPRLGHYVILSYADGSRSTYGHLKDYRVGTGQLVGGWEAIGRVGSSGRPPGPHLDFRLEVDGWQVNPLPVLISSMALAEN